MASQESSMMRLYQLRSPGPISKSLTLTTAPRPSENVEKGKILVQVAAAGLNPADYKIAESGAIARVQFSFPKPLGMDFSGRVVAVGADVPGINPGDNVLGRMYLLGTAGSLSEYVVASYSDVATLPPNVTLDQAGGVATAALTAYQTLVPVVKPGDKVFINGGAGGTGTFAIQIAKTLGCHVTVTCSTAKVALCKELGADEVIDYKTTDVAAKLREGGRLYKVAVDNVGHTDLFGLADEYLLPDGCFRLVGAPNSLATGLTFAKNLASSKLLPTFLGGSRHKFDAYVTKNSHEELAQIAAWMGEGKLKTVVDSVYEFEDTLKAYEKLKGGSATGKILVKVRKDDV